MTTTSQSDNAAQKPKGGLARRLLIALLFFAVFEVLAILLPVAPAGELSTDQMTAHSATACQSCPPTEQITAAGMVAGDNAWYLNVRFAAPPFNSRLVISFSGVPGVLALQQAGSNWTNLSASTTAPVAAQAISQSDNQIVVALPDTLRTDGFSVSTGSGDHLPDTGYLQPTYPPAAHFNATDVVLLLILAATAWFGYKRGFMPEVGDLVAIGLSIAVGALLYKPLAAWSAGLMSYPRVGAALVSCILVLASGITMYAVLPRIIPRLSAAAPSLNPAVDGSAGGLIACVRNLGVLAMLLTAGSDLSVLHWASASINSSLIGTTLLHAWRGLYAGS